jgi:hypothetical protein
VSVKAPLEVLADRLMALERRVADLERAAAGEDVTVEQPVGVLEAGHRAFIERIRGGRA